MAAVDRHTYGLADPGAVMRDERRRRVFAEAPHVVLLGAGASKACVVEHGGDRHGRAVPLLDEIQVCVPGVAELLEEAARAGVSIGGDFEANFAAVCATDATRQISDKMEQAIVAFFSELELPERATVYDHLMLSLRSKDLVASFNWDPLLEQARSRLAMTGFMDLPRIVYLHGNVTIGVCSSCGKKARLGQSCICGGALAREALLFPDVEKDYSAHREEWETVTEYIGRAKRLTVFGYSGPQTDEEALDILSRAWGPLEVKYTEWPEVITRPIVTPEKEREIYGRWEPFIPFTTHFTVAGDFFESSVAQCPRRTIEHWEDVHQHGRICAFDPAPRNLDVPATIAWYAELAELE